MHEFRLGVPALRDEFQRALEAGGEAVQGVDGETEDGGAGDEGGGYGDAFGGGFAEAGGGDGRVQAQGFVDGAVEVGEGLEGSGVGVCVQLVELGTNFGDLRRVEGEVVEEHDERGGCGVGAGDDDPEGVAVEPTAVGLEGVVLARSVDEPGGDVVVLAVIFTVDAFAHLGVGPYEHRFPAGSHAGDAEADPGEPGHGREETEKRHPIAHQVDGEMTFSGCEHVEGFAEGELAHEVEGQVVEPGCYIQWRTQTLGYGGREDRGVMVYLRFVLV